MSLVWSEYSYQKLVYACFSLWQQNNTVKATGEKQQHINMPNLQQTTECFVKQWEEMAKWSGATQEWTILKASSGN